MSQDLSNFSMFDLFRVEVENQAQVLTAGLLALERDPTTADQLEAAMRAAHSLKGAARIVGLEAGVSVAHAMEDCFVAAQQGRITLHQARIDLLLRGVDLLARIAHTPETQAAQWAAEKKPEVDEFLAALAGAPDESPVTPPPSGEPSATTPAQAPEAVGRESSDRVLRVT
ncbi:MAG TPA: Hpt domain-containing protein, partial [Burkholderiaceae bacterium]|nr:Hpt domain-containing protein [Burkholderiaceae bacterium]